MKVGIMNIEIDPKTGKGMREGYWWSHLLYSEGKRIYKIFYKESKSAEFLKEDPYVNDNNAFYESVLYFYMIDNILSENPEMEEYYYKIKNSNEKSRKVISYLSINRKFLRWYEDYLREQADPGILEREKRQREVDAYIARTRYEREQAEREAHQVRCPYCNSTRTEKIGAVSRAVSISMTGLASGKIGKQWHCKDCKSDF